MIPSFSPRPERASGPGSRSMALSRALPALGALLLLSGCGGEAPRPGEGGPWDALLTPGTGRFLHVSSYDTTGGNRDRHELAPGDSVVLLDVEGPGVIRRIWVTVASEDPHYLRRIALKMYWDGEEEPSVAVPLGDFFGNGFSKVHYTALPMGVSSGGFYVYLPMPFRSRARIVAENGTGRVVDAFYFNADLEEGVELPRRLATFHAAWNRDSRTTAPAPHTVLEAAGSGHLVGVSLNAESYSGSYWFLEGDEIFTVDGEPRGQGTGTEDYFNGGWYFQDGPFAAPYHGVVLMEEDRGRVAAYRWHLPDPVRFRDSIRMEIENGHGNEEVADYATVAYWYQTEPHRPLPPLPSPDDRRVLDVKVPPEAVPGDSLRVVEGEEGGRRLLVPVPRPDRYRLLVYPRAADGRPGEPVDRGITAVSGSRIELSLDAGKALPAAVHPRPVRRWATEWMVVGPFPNPQPVGTEHSPALDSVYGPELDPGLHERHPLAPSLRASGKGGARADDSIGWFPISGDETGYVRLNPHFRPADRVAAYVQTFLYSPREGEILLLLGADDAHQLWFNGDLVSSRQGRHIAVTDELEIPVSARRGWNRVLLKVADLDGGWAIRLRVADPGGEIRWGRRPGD